MKKGKLIGSILAGILLFIIIWPYSHDMYIGLLHTICCVLLNGLSSVLFAVFLYKFLARNFPVKDFGPFLWYLVILGVLHGIFAFMNWGSWICLGLTGAVLIWMGVCFIREKR